MRAEDVIGAVLRGVLVSRPRRSSRTQRHLGYGGLLSARNIMTAAAAAWSLYEAVQNQGATGSAASPNNLPPQPAAPPRSAPGLPSVGAGEAPTGPPPLPQGAAPPAEDTGFPPEVARLVRLLIGAARADGDLKPEEGALIARHAAEAGAEGLVRAELQGQPSLADVVGRVDDAAAAAQLYTVAFAVLRADEDVSAAERSWLEELQGLLRLDAPTARRLEERVAREVDGGEEPSS